MSEDSLIFSFEREDEFTTIVTVKNKEGEIVTQLKLTPWTREGTCYSRPAPPEVAEELKKDAEYRNREGEWEIISGTLTRVSDPMYVSLSSAPKKRSVLRWVRDLLSRIGRST
jgi:hypothetical protein